MERKEIERHINNGAINYLDLLADAKHMNLVDDGFCTMIYPNEGEEGGTSIYNFRFEGMSDEEIARRIKQVKEKKIHTFWGCFLPRNIMDILKMDDPNSGEDDDSEAYMAMLPDEKPEYDLPKPPIMVKKVENQQQFEIWTNISNEVLHDGYTIMHPENHYHLCEEGKLECYIGFYDEKPVATAAIMNDNGIASLEFVATLNDFRKKGLGGAVCRAAVDDAFKYGAKIITLRGFPLGQPVYKSMGFKRY